MLEALRIIAIPGPFGTGKTTLAHGMQEYLAQLGTPVSFFEELRPDNVDDFHKYLNAINQQEPQPSKLVLEVQMDFLNHALDQAAKIQRQSLNTKIESTQYVVWEGTPWGHLAHAWRLFQQGYFFAEDWQRYLNRVCDTFGSLPQPEVFIVPLIQDVLVWFDRIGLRLEDMLGSDDAAEGMEGVVRAAELNTLPESMKYQYLLWRGMVKNGVHIPPELTDQVFLSQQLANSARMLALMSEHMDFTRPDVVAQVLMLAGVYPSAYK